MKVGALTAQLLCRSLASTASTGSAPTCRGSVTSAHVALGYQNLLEAERGFLVGRIKSIRLPHRRSQPIVCPRTAELGRQQQVSSHLYSRFGLVGVSARIR